jgi:hypothetical protein
MKLVVNNDKPRPREKRVKAFPSCPSCSSHTVMEIRTLGTKEYICAHCFSKGRMVTCK